jgi:signal transduction histidine kinase
MSEALAASDLTPDQRELVNAMLSSGVIIADILGDILDLASVESGIQLLLHLSHPLSFLLWKWPLVFCKDILEFIGF